MVKFVSSAVKIDAQSVDKDKLSRSSRCGDRLLTSNQKKRSARGGKDSMVFDELSSKRLHAAYGNAFHSMQNSPRKRNVSKDSKRSVRSPSNMSLKNDNLKLEITLSNKRTVFAFKKISNDYISMDKKDYPNLFGTLYQYMKENYMIDKKFVEDLVADYRCWTIANQDYISYAKEEQQHKVNSAQSEIDKKLGDLTKINNQKLNEKIEGLKENIKPVDSEIVAELISTKNNDKKINENFDSKKINENFGSQKQLTNELFLLKNKSNILKRYFISVKNLQGNF